VRPSTATRSTRPPPRRLRRVVGLRATGLLLLALLLAPGLPGGSLRVVSSVAGVDLPREATNGAGPRLRLGSLLCTALEMQAHARPPANALPANHRACRSLEHRPVCKAAKMPVALGFGEHSGQNKRGCEPSTGRVLLGRDAPPTLCTLPDAPCRDVLCAQLDDATRRAISEDPIVKSAREKQNTIEFFYSDTWRYTFGIIQQLVALPGTANT
jgi:hypothetical protein